MAKVIIFGIGSMAEVLHSFFTHDSPHEVVGFSVDGEFVTADTLCGLPVVPFEDVVDRFPPGDYEMTIPLGFKGLNRLRQQKFDAAKVMGYPIASYVSSRALTWPDLVIGENSHIFGDAHILPYARIEDNVIIGSGSIIGHHTLVKSHCFIAPAAVLLGEVTIGEFSVIGPGATIQDGVDVARDCVVGAGAFISRSTQEGGAYFGARTVLSDKSSYEIGRFKP